MSRHITEDDISLGYSSEPDEYESEQVQDLLLAAEPFEIYVGNTGKVSYHEYFKLFSQHGLIKDMNFWRTHDHLYHARIVYQSKAEADKATELMNNRMFFTKRIRVTYAKKQVSLYFPAAIRIDDICADISEEDIFDHFLSCGDIRFVIKTGYAAYIQFASSASATKALGLEMILNGDPYSLTRISADDKIDHVQVIENMKDIKHRKPFVIVENYPELPPGTPLCRFKSNFESIGPVRHFKIAPTADGTVTLALCMDKADRNLVIDRFNNAVIKEKRLKVYMTPGKARMTAQHVAKYAICRNSITADNIPPYFKDYDVCTMFSRCGSISFVEKIVSRWIICFDSPSVRPSSSSSSSYFFTAVNLAHNYYTFKLFEKVVETDNLTQDTFPKKRIKLQDADANKLPEEEKNNSGQADDFLSDALKKIGKNIQSMTSRELPSDVATKLQTFAHQVKQVNTPSKTRDNVMVVKATPMQPKPPTSQTMKRPVNDNGPNTPLARTRQDSSTDLTDGPNRYKFCLALCNLPKGIDENDLRELYRNQEMKSVALYCSKDPYYSTSVAIINLTNNQDYEAIASRHHHLYRGKRIGIYHAITYAVHIGWDFPPDNSLMLKNLPKNVTEEGIAEMLVRILGASTVEDVLNPTHHYAYVEFKESVTVPKVLNQLRNALTRFKIDVFPLYRKLPKTWMNLRSHDRKTIDQARLLFGSLHSNGVKDADKEFGVHNAHKLFVGNIPRDTQTEDVIDYFNNFGSVIDYAPIEKKSCYLRKSVILSFVNSNHAQNAYCQQPHYLEGSELDVHLMDSPPLQFGADLEVVLLTVKFHSPFLTNDEIRHALQKVVGVSYNIRFDAFDDRANYVAKCTFPDRLKYQLATLFQMQYIKDEAVKIVQGYDATPPKEDEAREHPYISNSPYRQQKEQYLNFAISKEKLKDDMKVRSKPNKEEDVFKSFYNNSSIQINNVSQDTTLEYIRDLFIKCGDIEDYRALLLEEDASKICYIKFKIALAADLACTYSQRMANGKRILVHLAKETLHAERDRSVLVERLDLTTTAEQLHDAFTPIGTVKYVQKQSPFSAIVCFKEKDSVLEAVHVTAIPNSESFIISPCYEEYDPRLINNFSCQEEFIPIERMRAALKPRVLPEFHQLELERQVFETLPDDIKTRLIHEVFLARERFPNFNKLTKQKQINALKTEYQDFTQKEHFLRLTSCEQEKLLEVASNLQRDYPHEEVKDLEVLPPAPKQSRNEEPVSKKTDKAFAADWYSNPSEATEETVDPYPPDLEPQLIIEPLVTAKIATHVTQTFPTSDLLEFPGNNPPSMEFSQPGNMFPRGGGPQFPNMYPQQGPSPFAGRMPPFRGPNRPMMGPWPRPMMRPPMGMRPQMGLMPPAGPPDYDRWMQQRMVAMAYNAGPPMREPMGFDEFFDRPPYFS